MKIGDKVIAYAMDMMVEGVVVEGIKVSTGLATLLPGAEVQVDGQIRIEDGDRTVTINGWNWDIEVVE